ncbi:hypothetical protein EC991_010989, partial [Linnemannia zychae]
MESLVMPVDPKFHKRLRKARKTGLTRLEVTFYGSKIHEYAYYADYLEYVKEQLQECTTYKVPYKNYWRPIYFLEVSLDDLSQDIAVTKYMRPDGCTEMTLVAGRQNGLYPYIYHDDVYEFADMGIVTSKNIIISWPDNKHHRISAAIADIHQVALDGKDMYMYTETLIGLKSSYMVGHGILRELTEYTMIAAVWGEFREQACIFSTLSNGYKIRCGKSLEHKVVAWLDRHNAGKVPYMQFTTTTKRTVRGYRDML